MGEGLVARLSAVVRNEMLPVSVFDRVMCDPVLLAGALNKPVGELSDDDYAATRGVAGLRLESFNETVEMILWHVEFDRSGMRRGSLRVLCAAAERLARFECEDAGLWDGSVVLALVGALVGVAPCPGF